ncbi:ABC transporter permease [Paenibacillus xerothermodurans]|uniref:Sugar ABC transporter permease n=1 Tax=Paenibacillus xerothermodurans TaxID=1977292 RepID=A0A2W1ND09_PAEXE|nr:ABC transporter permease subunit [Paenibacillus xerothermodurans]PZE22579.1 sugar ABC transporter permease [Paenibacillus xerothermodurans]
MARAKLQAADTISYRSSRTSLWHYMWKYKVLYLLTIPGIVYYLVFKYIPLGASFIAFKDYNIFKGVFGSPWVGLKHFERMFQHADFLRILKNTFILGGLDILLAFPAPIIIALMLNELRLIALKRIVQTVIYMPHFLSWVIIGGIAVGILSPSTGVVNQFIKWLGFEPIYFLAENSMIRSVFVTSGIWKEVGWGTIIYLAALAGVNPDLYEAAEIDGANRWQQTLAVTIPTILPTITILFLLKIGEFLDYGFERVWVFLNPLTYENGEILDTYIYRAGLLQQEYSYTTAVGLFKSLVGLTMLFVANKLSKKATGESLF